MWHDMQKQLEKNRTPADILAARGVSPTPACSCPFCGIDPPNATMNRYGYFVVGCDNDDCPIQPQVSRQSMSEAWRLWNGRAK
jgi:hypothetical protein